MPTDTLELAVACDTMDPTDTIIENGEYFHPENMTITKSYDFLMETRNDNTPLCRSLLEVGRIKRANPDGSLYPHSSLGIRCQLEHGHSGFHSAASNPYENPEVISNHPFTITWEAAVASDDTGA